MNDETNTEDVALLQSPLSTDDDAKQDNETALPLPSARDQTNDDSFAGTSTSPSKTKQEDASKTYQGTASMGVKIFFLVSILSQNCGYTLIRRFDRAILNDKSSDSSILITNEFIKIFVSLFMGLWTYFSASSASSASSAASAAPTGSSSSESASDQKSVCKYAIKLVRTCPKLFVPSVIYLIQGWVSFLSVARVDACTYTALTQCKLVTTAVAGYLFLQRRFSMVQIVSLVHLVCGVVIIVFVTFEAATKDSSDDTDDSDDSESAGEKGVKYGGSFVLGVICGAIETCLSGVNVVFVEKVFKDDKKDLSVWDRNVQMSMFSIAIWMWFFVQDGGYQHWGWVTFAISCVGSVGGILIAFSVKYADSVLKTIAVSGSVVMTSLLSALLLGGPYNTPIAAASVTVVVAVASYVTNGKLGDAVKICS